MLDALVGSLAANRAAINALQALDASMLTAALALAEDRASTRGGSADLEIREIAAEIGAALRMSDRSVQRHLSDAHTLSTRFRTTHRAQSEGRISRAHADVIMDAAVRIADDTARAAFEDEVLLHAERESAARLRPIAKMIAERALPESIDERHARARIARHVTVRDLPDAMAELRVAGPANQIHGVFDRLSQMATVVSALNKREAADARAAAMKRQAENGANAVSGERESSGDAGDEFMPDVRTPDQLGTDMFIDLLPTGTPAGHGPTHVLEAMRRLLRVRDQHCRFPGCRLPVRYCDADHLIDAAGADRRRARTLPVHAVAITCSNTRPRGLSSISAAAC